MYDRQEVIEVLEHLRVEGYLSSLKKTSNGWDAFPPDDKEETMASWFLGDRCWFQV